MKDKKIINNNTNNEKKEGINIMQRINIIKCEVVREKSILYDNAIFKSPQIVADIMRKFLGNTDREHFVVAYLNTKNKINAIHTVSVGNLNGSLVHPREVFKAAILSNAASIICCHNHPSGNVLPSGEDIKVTENLIKTGELLNISVLDHVIIDTDSSNYYSMKEHQDI